MEGERMSARSKERYFRRKNSKSPISIRGKIRELEGQIEKNQKGRDIHKNAASPGRPISNTNDNITMQNINQAGSTNPAQNFTPKNQDKSKRQIRSKVGMKNDVQVGNRISNTMMQSQVRNVKERSSSGKLLRRNSDNSPNPKKTEAQDTQEDLKKLKQQNRRFRDVYSRSLQKLQKLQTKLKQMRFQQASQKSSWQKTYNALQSNIQKKASVTQLAHIYSYETKGVDMMMMQDRIIAEIENENSSCVVDQSRYGQRSPSPMHSVLSIQSKGKNK